jgi:hypothetical protein
MLLHYYNDYYYCYSTIYLFVRPLKQRRRRGPNSRGNAIVDPSFRRDITKTL